MALSTAQIISLACQAAKVPGWIAQAGQILNEILEEVCGTYDIDQARGLDQFNFNPGLISNINNNVVPGGGPYPLPADYLRADPNDVFWTLLGVPYFMINIDLNQFDATVQQSGLQSYPYWYATDLSQSPPVMYVYPPPSGAYPVTVRYRRLMADIATPETNDNPAWFPWSSYLRRRLTGELCVQTGDSRAESFLGDGPHGAQGILRRYLNMANDKAGRANMVKLDRRLFGGDFSKLKNTKSVGW